MKVKRITRVGAAVAACLLLGTACASERSDTATPADEGVQNDDNAGESMFGTLQSPCGEGDASSATDQGVTADSITIGYGDDRGFTAAPGLSQEMGDAVAAMIGWCNEQGGINGREIDGNRYDAAYTQAPQVMQEACAQDFMLVGQGFAMDDAAEAIRVGCQLPSVPGFTIGANATMGPMKYSSVPLPVDFYNSAPLQLAAETFPAFRENMDLLGSTSSVVTVANDRIRSALESMDITPKNCGVVLNQEGDPSYVPFAERLKQCEVEALFSSDSPDAGQFNLLESIERVGIEPTYVFEATWYSDAVREWNASGAGDNINVGISFQPFENASEEPAVQQYLDIVNEQDGKTALLGMQATSSFLLWATAAQACGDDLTRQCMINELSQVNEWTGGGLHAETDPGNNMPASCALMVGLTGTEWEQVAPAEQGEFACDDEWILETDPATWNTELNDDRVSTAFLTEDVIEPTI